VCGFQEFNPELGGSEAFDRFSKTLCEHGLGLLIDVVPNHMSIDVSNVWWLDVLEHGRGVT
jgi:(1->4)-alpha-D-glucan 1-alpha-D-glucosylmutase